MDTELKKFIYHKNQWTLPSEERGGGSKVEKPKVGKLIFKMGGKEEIIYQNKPFAFLKAEMKKMEKDPNFKGGKLIITY